MKIEVILSHVGLIGTVFSKMPIEHNKAAEIY
jgi:hypothetical protein